MDVKSVKNEPVKRTKLLNRLNVIIPAANIRIKIQALSNPYETILHKVKTKKGFAFSIKFFQFLYRCNRMM